MPRLIELPWDSQPQEAVELDQSGEFFPGLTLAYFPGISLSRSFVGNPTISTFSGSGYSIGATPDGVGMVGASNAASGAASITDLDAATENATVIVLFKPFLRSPTAAAGSLIRVPHPTSLNLRLGQSNAADRRFALQNTFTTVAKEPRVFVARTSGSSGAYVAEEALFDFEELLLSNSLNYTATFGFGAIELSPVRGMQEVLGAFAWKDRYLTNAECIRFANAPNRLFRPQQIYVPTLAAAPTLPTLSLPRAQPGSITSSGWVNMVTAS